MYNLSLYHKKRFLPQPDCSVINKVHGYSLLKNEPEFKNNRYCFVLLFLIVSCLLRTKILTLPITSFRWDLNFRRDRSKEQFYRSRWVGVLVDWRNRPRSSEGWGKCLTDEIWDEQTRTVLFILRFAYWLQILRTHASFFMVNIVVTVVSNFNYGLNRRSRDYNSGGLMAALWSVVLTTRFIFCCWVGTVWILSQKILFFM